MKLFAWMLLSSTASSFSRSTFNTFKTRSRTFFTKAAAMSLTTTTNPNPYLNQGSTPKFSQLTPELLTPALEELLEQTSSKLADLESSLGLGGASDFKDVLPKVEEIQSPLEYVWGVAGHLNGVKNSNELREAYESAQPRVVQTFTKFSQSKPLYDALVRVQEAKKAAAGNDSSFRSQQEARAVELAVQAMRLGGVGFDEPEKKERFNEILMKLAELSTKFSNNILDSTKAFGLTLEGEDISSMMKDVPSSAKGMWAQAYATQANTENKEKEEKADEVAADPENGPWRITLDGPSYISAMQHLPDRSIREQIYKEYITRASEKSESMNNVPIIMEILALKQEQAKMLGFNNFAEMSLARKMAPSVDAVEELTDLIAEKAVPAAAKELEEITEFARGKSDEVKDIEKLMPWDVTFWSERYREEKFAVTEEELRPYFALPAVLEGMFGLVQRIFGIVVKPANGEAEIWNDDVQFFKVFDEESDKHIASFYLDPYSRPADKRGGAWMDVCLQKSDVIAGRTAPVAYLTCNGTPPVGDKPSLMTFREVETLFHEFGHGLQHMLTKAEVADVSGINGVEWDAVELPSQFMENWCYDKPTVYGFAKHYETGEALPEELFEKLKQQRTYSAGLMATRQLYFGALDMKLHCSTDVENLDIFAVQKEVAQKYTPHNLPLDEDRFLCTFGHIFGGGYAAGYYSYKWAEVMSADAFGAFEDVGLDNEEEVRKVGRKFRDTVLSLGGGVHPSQVFEAFRGRQPTPDALLRHNGLN